MTTGRNLAVYHDKPPQIPGNILLRHGTLYIQAMDDGTEPDDYPGGDRVVRTTRVFTAVLLIAMLLGTDSMGAVGSITRGGR